MQTTTIRCHSHLLQRLDDLANTNKRSRSWVITQALTEYVERASRQEQYKAETIESWRQFQETGLHVTGEELKTWLETWGTSHEQDVPTCHV